jgi:uncharacterized membrane protein YjdF
MEQRRRRFEILIIVAFFLASSYLLFRMAYLPGYVSLPVGLGLLAAFRLFLLRYYGVRVPVFLLALLWLSIVLDWLGNIFKLYEHKFAWVQYDEFTHTAIPLLVMPLMVWLLNTGIKRFNYRLPLALVTLFAITAAFTLSGFYEVLELWDDKYMHPTPGWRIHGAYDTANDLQCDLLGMIAGGLLAYVWLKKGEGRG